MPHKRQRTEEEPDNEGILENPEKPSPPKKRARTSAGSETARKQDVEKDAVIKEAPAAAKVNLRTTPCLLERTLTGGKGSWQAAPNGHACRTQETRCSHEQSVRQESCEVP